MFGTCKHFVNVDFAFKDINLPSVKAMQTAFAKIDQNMTIFFDSKQ